MKKVLLTLLSILFLVGLVGCSSTADAVKEETQKAGDAIEQKITDKAAEKIKNLLQ